METLEDLVHISEENMRYLIDCVKIPMQELKKFKVKLPGGNEPFYVAKLKDVEKIIDAHHIENKSLDELWESVGDIDNDFLANVWLEELTWCSDTPNGEMIRNQWTHVHYFMEKLSENFDLLLETKQPEKEIAKWIRGAEYKLYTEYLISEIKSYRGINKNTKRPYPIDWKKIKEHIQK